MHEHTETHDSSHSVRSSALCQLQPLLHVISSVCRTSSLSSMSTSPLQAVCSPGPSPVGCHLHCSALDTPLHVTPWPWWPAHCQVPSGDLWQRLACVALAAPPMCVPSSHPSSHPLLLPHWPFQLCCDCLGAGEQSRCRVFGQKRTREYTADGLYLRAEIPQTSLFSAGPLAPVQGKKAVITPPSYMKTLKPAASRAQASLLSSPSVGRRESPRGALGCAVRFPLFPNTESPLPGMSCCQGDPLKELNDSGNV